MTPALQTRDLSIGYRRRPPVLQHLDLAVEPGEMVCLIGSNGIGKSTLLRTLAGMQPPVSGSVIVGGTDIKTMSAGELARHMAVILTERVSIGAMPAQRLVELGRYPHVDWSGHLEERDHRVVREAITAVGAEHLAERDINELSDGERQRIMIARALAQEPAVLLLDEPSAFLDISARVEIVAMLRQLARKRGVAVILSSHDLELSLRTADTIWLVEGQGRVHVGAPEDLLANGSIAAAFSRGDILFAPADRTFRIRTQPRGLVFAEGAPEQVALAQTVLEREGFAFATRREDAVAVVSVQAQGWVAEINGAQWQGKNFGELARFFREQS